MQTNGDSNAAIWKAFPKSNVTLWNQNLVNGEYVIAFKINPGLGQKLKNLLPEVCDIPYVIVFSIIPIFYSIISIYF